MRVIPPHNDNLVPTKLKLQNLLFKFYNKNYENCLYHEVIQESVKTLLSFLKIVKKMSIWLKHTQESKFFCKFFFFCYFLQVLNMWALCWASVILDVDCSQIVSFSNSTYSDELPVGFIIMFAASVGLEIIFLCWLTLRVDKIFRYRIDLLSDVDINGALVAMLGLLFAIDGT